MVDRVKITNLHKPSSNTLHNLTASLEAAAPVCLPLEQVARVKRVGAEFKDTTELSGRCGGPERKFLHERNLLRVDHGAELLVEFSKLGIVRDAMARLVVTLVLLVFPDVDYIILVQFDAQKPNDLPNVSQSPTSVLQLPTKCTLFSGAFAMRG